MTGSTGGRADRRELARRVELAKREKLRAAAEAKRSVVTVSDPAAGDRLAASLLSPPTRRRARRRTVFRPAAEQKTPQRRSRGRTRLRRSAPPSFRKRPSLPSGPALRRKGGACGLTAPISTALSSRRSTSSLCVIPQRTSSACSSTSPPPSSSATASPAPAPCPRPATSPPPQSGSPSTTTDPTATVSG